MERSEQNSAEPANNKEPWFAVNLSRILPGIGQLYAGKTVKGYLILALYILSLPIGLWLLIDPAGNALAGIWTIVIATILHIWNIFDAYHTARTGNSSEFESARKAKKDVWLGLFLSGLIPGLGHLYLRRLLPGILFFGAFIVVSSVSNLGKLNPVLFAIGILLECGLTAFSLYHLCIFSPIDWQRYRRTILRFIAGFIASTVVVIPIIPLAIREFIAESRFIPSGSMLPTLDIDDRLMINKLTYRFHAPERGDIAIFMPTETLQKENYRDPFISRIIGIPGDRIEIKNGRVYLNGNVQVENYITKGDEKSQQGFESQIVPPDSYLVLGDNRANSYDSRYWGFVPRANIIGKATQRFFPFDRVGSITSNK
jgi:signal peptidase I